MGEKKKEELIEAVLFLAGRFLSVQELVMLTNINPLTLRELLIKLQERYSKHSTLTIIAKGDSYKMDVKPDYAYLINKLASGPVEFSKAEQESLAIVAYKQPITQAVVVKIRGNKAYNHIKNLLQAGLIKAKKAGRTLELKLDDKFYNYFGVKKQEEQEEQIKEKNKEKSIGE